MNTSSDVVEDSSFGVQASNLTVDNVRPLPSCPKCGSRSVNFGPYKDSFDSIIKRYVCRNSACKYHFSDPQDLKTAREFRARFSALDEITLKNDVTSPMQYQLCVEGTKKLETEQQKQNVALLETSTNINLTIGDYKHFIKKENLLNDLTLSKYSYRLLKLAREFKVNLYDPEDYKEKLVSDPVMSQWSNCNKNSYSKAVAHFTKNYLHIKDAKIPFFDYRAPEHILPQTEHMEALYNELSPQMRVFCFVLMASAARPVEALRMEWADIDFVRKTISINKPAKKGRTRTINCSNRFKKVIDMLARWQEEQRNIAADITAKRILCPTYRDHNYPNLNPAKIFTYKNYDAAYQNFRTARARAAKRTHIDELNSIIFYDNRHWRATLERYLQGNSDAVQLLLGQNSGKYVEVYAPLSERIFGSHKEWQPLEISEEDPDYSEKMMSAGAEGYHEYNYNQRTGKHYLRREKLEF